MTCGSHHGEEPGNSRNDPSSVFQTPCSFVVAQSPAAATAGCTHRSPAGAGGLSRRAVLGTHGLHPNRAAVLPSAWPSPRSVDVQEVFYLSVASKVS